MAEQKPSVGRVVRYNTPGSLDGKFPPGSMAAIITSVLDDEDVAENGVPFVHLFVMYETGTSHRLNVEFSANATPGTWSWPVIS